MRYSENIRSGKRKHGFSSLQAWLKKAFAVRREKNRKCDNISEFHKLSDHLLNDLGFDDTGRPLGWSSFSPKNTSSTEAGVPGKVISKWKNHCHC